MQKLGLISLAVVGSLSLGACGTIGQPVERTIAEVKERCEDRGGTLRLNGRTTGQPNRDLTCTGAVRASVPQGPITQARNNAVDRSLRSAPSPR